MLYISQGVKTVKLKSTNFISWNGDSNLRHNSEEFKNAFEDMKRMDAFEDMKRMVGDTLSVGHRSMPVGVYCHLAWAKRLWLSKSTPSRRISILRLWGTVSRDPLKLMSCLCLAWRLWTWSWWIWTISKLGDDCLVLLLVLNCFQSK